VTAGIVAGDILLLSEPLEKLGLRATGANLNEERYEF